MGAKRFQASGYATPPPRNLLVTRTEGISPYQVIGVHYAGPLRDRSKKKNKNEKHIFDILAALPEEFIQILCRT